ALFTEKNIAKNLASYLKGNESCVIVIVAAN
ncbi:MAG: hypothetical protein ACI9WS_002039, partial [Paraglaciecola psychrophila]